MNTFMNASVGVRTVSAICCTQRTFPVIRSTNTNTSTIITSTDYIHHHRITISLLKFQTYPSRFPVENKPLQSPIEVHKVQLHSFPLAVQENAKLRLSAQIPDLEEIPSLISSLSQHAKGAHERELFRETVWEEITWD